MTADRSQILLGAIDRALTEVDAALAYPADDPDAYKAGLKTVKQKMVAPSFLTGITGAPEMPSPAVSVVLPTYNRAGLVADAIASVQAQMFRDWELLVIDDGSLDNTEEIVRSFAADGRIKYLYQSHGGHASARNHALRRSIGTLIAYIDSDNLWYPDFLKAAVVVFALCNAVDLIYGALVSDVHLPQPKTILFEEFDRKRLIANNYIDLNTIVHRRSLIETYGLFDESLDRLVDWDLALRFTQHKPAYRVPVLAAQYRVLDDQRVTLRPLEPSYSRVRRKWLTDTDMEGRGSVCGSG